MTPLRTGVFGGTFDPIHVGHLHIADAVADVMDLQRVLFVPVGDPAHRRTHAAAHHRRAMTDLAIADNERFSLDVTGLEQPAPAYTADTIALLHTAHPHDTFFFIAGVDALTRSRWRRLDEVARAVERFYVVMRPGTEARELEPLLATLSEAERARFEIVDVTPMDVSSTEIRKLVSERRSIRYLVPDAVARYIADEGLYRTSVGPEGGE